MIAYQLSDAHWQRLAPLLPGKASDCGVRARDNRLFLNAVLWMARTGAAWPTLPAHFGKPNSIHRRFRRWAQKGIWQRLFEQLQEPELDWLLLDSTVVRAHQHAAGQKKAVPRSKPLAVAVAG